MQKQCALMLWKSDFETICELRIIIKVKTCYRIFEKWAHIKFIFLKLTKVCLKFDTDVNRI